MGEVILPELTVTKETADKQIVKRNEKFLPKEENHSISIILVQKNSRKKQQNYTNGSLLWKKKNTTSKENSTGKNTISISSDNGLTNIWVNSVRVVKVVLRNRSKLWQMLVPERINSSKRI